MGCQLWMCCMRLIHHLKLYEPHRPSCMTLIQCMRDKLIHESYMSLIQNLCIDRKAPRALARSDSRSTSESTLSASPPHCGVRSSGTGVEYRNQTSLHQRRKIKGSNSSNGTCTRISDRSTRNFVAPARHTNTQQLSASGSEKTAQLTVVSYRSTLPRKLETYVMCIRYRTIYQTELYYAYND